MNKFENKKINQNIASLTIQISSKTNNFKVIEWKTLEIEKLMDSGRKSRQLLRFDFYLNLPNGLAYAIGRKGQGAVLESECGRESCCWGHGGVWRRELN